MIVLIVSIAILAVLEAAGRRWACCTLPDPRTLLGYRVEYFDVVPPWLVVSRGGGDAAGVTNPCRVRLTCLYVFVCVFCFPTRCPPTFFFQVEAFILEGLAMRIRDKRTLTLPSTDKTTRTEVEAPKMSPVGSVRHYSTTVRTLSP